MLKEFELEIIKAIQSLHTDTLDVCMVTISDPKSFLLPLGIIVYCTYTKLNDKKAFFWSLALFAISVGLADYFSSGILKPWVARLRPCHDPEIRDSIRIVNNYFGGKYSFASSHAATSAAMVASFLIRIPVGNSLRYILIVWALLVALSRVYLGVHFLSDVLVGACIGIGFSYGVYSIFLFCKKKKLQSSQ
ncbi:MAG: phosphatase PAP2 family protein [Leadbetterella sp.]